MFPGMGGMPPQGGGNPMMQMMQQMMGGGMGQMMQNPQFAQMAQQIMGGKVNPQQMQGMFNQSMGGKAPDLMAIANKIKEMEARGEVIVTNNKQAFQKANEMGMGKLVRYSDKVNGFDVMSLGKFEIEYK